MMAPDPIREADLRRVGYEAKISSNGITVQVQMDAGEWDRLLREGPSYQGVETPDWYDDMLEALDIAERTFEQAESAARAVLHTLERTAEAHLEDR